MTTTQAIMEPVLWDVLEKAAPSAVSLEDFYTEVSTQIMLDEGDMVPPQHHGQPVKEPRWRRNVRNVLQHWKEAGKVVNEERNLWRLPTPDPSTLIEVDGTWELFRHAAMIAMKTSVEWESPVEKKRYKVYDVGSNYIMVDRIDASSPARIPQKTVERAIKQINAAGGSAKRRSVNYTVAIESAIVFLHPALAWDEAGSNVVAFSGHDIAVGENAALNAAESQLVEAVNDDPSMIQKVARKIRKGQSAFRANLMRVYGGKCVVTGASTSSVLEAAHIDQHKKSGNNNSRNGQLLRSDIHCLFDDGLMFIEPNTGLVMMHPSLVDSDYWQYNGKFISKRLDGQVPDSDSLDKRWGLKTWK